MDELKISLFIGLVVLMSLLIIAIYYTLPSYESFRVTQEIVDYSNNDYDYVEEEIPDEELVDEPEQQDKDNMVDPAMRESLMVPIDQTPVLPPQEESAKSKLNVLKFKINSNQSLTKDKLDTMKSSITNKFNDLMKQELQLESSEYNVEFVNGSVIVFMIFPEKNEDDLKQLLIKINGNVNIIFEVDGVRFAKDNSTPTMLMSENKMPEDVSSKYNILPLDNIVKVASDAAYNIVEGVSSNIVDGLDILADNLNTKTNKHVVAINN